MATEAEKRRARNKRLSRAGRRNLGQDNQRVQGGVGGIENTAGDGELLGGNQQSAQILRSQRNDTTQSSVEENRRTQGGFQRLGSEVLDSGNIGTTFQDDSGTASINTSVEGARRLASGRGTTSSLDFSGFRNEPAGVRAEVNAFQQGQRLGLSPTETLRLGRDAKIRSLPPGIEKEIALTTAARDDGRLDPAIAQERLNNLFSRSSTQQNADTNTFAAQEDAVTSAQKQERARVTRRQKLIADQRKAGIAKISDSGKRQTAAIKQIQSNQNNLNILDKDSPGFVKGQRDIAFAAVTPEIEDLRNRFNSGELTGESFQAATRQLQKTIAGLGVNVTADELIERLRQDTPDT